MAATPQNVEMEAAKFLHKLIQESTDEPTKLATKLHVGGISNNIAEIGMFRTEASRDTGKSPVLQAHSVGPSMPFKEHHLKLLRAQCLVFLAFRDNLMPKKLLLEFALGNFYPKEDINNKELIDQKGKEHSIGGQSISHEVGMPSSRIDNRETERTDPGYSSSGFISETNLLKEGEKLDRMIDKNNPPSGNNHDVEDNSQLNASPASPRSEKWIADCQKRKIYADNNWAVKKKKTEQRILACVEKLKLEDVIMQLEEVMM